MPIEIKELHIKVTVNPPEEGSLWQEPGNAGRGGSAANPIDQDALIAECVEQVLQILQNKTER
ncbi:DUF5908 family protein [Methylotuvimicrobium alcaliphilum]|uniref:Uncharacterized protein n=1 Tax=Methylotuvimicrobium alcaliphilum (strain DSM 19304 / NCIMB 14124 / VKM B-2133 / 20Z) TaxID=1091494 RepID=G4STB0_META2|nr:DUF5908 family protein [Methylotuvimicrobium alcaliphilum]CCE23863.1 conserved protein of unknown function [Methylotuvimicrobium alcaliphilum 20Z]